MIISGCIQTVFELLADLVSIVLLDQIFNIRVLHKAKGRKCYWSLPTVFHFMVSSAYVASGLTPYILCRSADAHLDLEWTLCRM